MNMQQFKFSSGSSVLCFFRLFRLFRLPWLFPLFNCVVVIALFYCFKNSNAFAATKVGNGGDVVDRHLESTRVAIFDALNLLEKDTQNMKLCESLLDLNSSQRNFCAQTVLIFSKTLKQRALGENRVSFRISNEPLYVEYPDGSKRSVAAGTSCGAAGDIVFHYDSIKIFTPQKMFALVFHELSHKIEFADEPCIKDEEEYGPFFGFDGGRKLLDAMGESVALYSLQKGLIGDEFGIVDVYYCEIFLKNSQIKIPSQIFSQRKFVDKISFTSYETGTGEPFGSLECSIQDALTNEIIALRIFIKETQNCSETPIGYSLENNSTKVSLMIGNLNKNRMLEWKELKAPSIVQENPICSRPKSERETIFKESFVTNYGNEIEFSLSYAHSFSSNKKFSKFEKFKLKQ